MTDKIPAFVTLEETFAGVSAGEVISRDDFLDRLHILMLADQIKAIGRPNGFDPPTEISSWVWRTHFPRFELEGCAVENGNGDDVEYHLGAAWARKVGIDAINGATGQPLLSLPTSCRR